MHMQLHILDNITARSKLNLSSYHTCVKRFKTNSISLPIEWVSLPNTKLQAYYARQTKN